MRTWHSRSRTAATSSRPDGSSSRDLPGSSWSTRTCERPTLAVRGLTPKGSGPSLSVADCRGRFPIFDSRVYVNSCSQGALAEAARASYQQSLAGGAECGARWEYGVERQEAARPSSAGLVNAGPDEIAVTPSLSAGVSAPGSGLRFPRRSKVVLTDW